MGLLVTLVLVGGIGSVCEEQVLVSLMGGGGKEKRNGVGVAETVLETSDEDGGVSVREETEFEHCIHLLMKRLFMSVLSWSNFELSLVSR